MAFKLYQTDATHGLGNTCQVVADFSNTEIEVIIPTEDQKADKDFKAKKAHGKFPMLETPEGDVVFESNAICMFLARRSSDSLIGSSAFEQAQVEQWLDISATQFFGPLVDIIYSTFGQRSSSSYRNSLKDAKKIISSMEAKLEGKKFLVGSSLTVADIVVFLRVSLLFSLALDASYRKSVPNVTAWAEGLRTHAAFVKRFGHIKFCEQAILPEGVSGQSGSYKLY